MRIKEGKEEIRISKIDNMLKSDKILDDEKIFKDVQSSISTDYSEKLNDCITKLKRVLL